MSRYYDKDHCFGSRPLGPPRPLTGKSHHQIDSCHVRPSKKCAILAYGSLSGSSLQISNFGDVIFDRVGPALNTVAVGNSRIRVLTAGVYEIIANVALVSDFTDFALRRNGIPILDTRFPATVINGNDNTTAVVHQIRLNEFDEISLGVIDFGDGASYGNRNLTIKRLS